MERFLLFSKLSQGDGYECFINSNSTTMLWSASHIAANKEMNDAGKH